MLNFEYYKVVFNILLYQSEIFKKDSLSDKTIISQIGIGYTMLSQLSVSIKLFGVRQLKPKILHLVILSFKHNAYPNCLQVKLDI